MSSEKIINKYLLLLLLQSSAEIFISFFWIELKNEN